MTRSNNNPAVLKSVHEVFALLLFLLAAVHGLHFQAIDQTPFATHSGSMWTFIVSVIIYCCAFLLSIYLQSQSSRDWMSPKWYWFLEKLSIYAVVAFGALAAVSLLSPLLPVLVGRFVFVLWAFIIFISIGFQHRTLLISKARQIWNRIRGNPLQLGLPISQPHDTTTVPANSTSGGMLLG